MTPHQPHPSAQAFMQGCNVVDATTAQANAASGAPAASGHGEAQTNQKLGEPGEPMSGLMMLPLLLGQPVGNLYPAFKTRRHASEQIKQLIAEGLLILVEVSHGKGRKLKLIQPTEEAWERLSPMGIHRPAMLVQGGELHDFAARAIRALAKKMGEQIRFEVPIGGVRFDAVWSREGKPQLNLNIGVSDPQREAESLSRALDEKVYCGAKLVHLGVSTRFNQGVRRRLKNLQPEFYEQVEYRLIGALIKAAYMEQT